MTIPRMLIPKQTYLVTRRCAQRMFLLSPGAEVNQVFQYCLAHASKRFNIEVHAYIVLSNHYHLVLSETDSEVKLPMFMHWLNLHIAKALNIFLDREENFWSSKPYSAVLLADAEAVLDKIAYTVLNAVSSNLVARPEQWLGAKSTIRQFTRTIQVFSKPILFFKDNSPLPNEESLALTIPPQFSDRTRSQFRILLQKEIRRRIEELKNAASIAEELRKFQPPASIYDRPRGREPKVRFNPRFACKDKVLRKELLARWKNFLAAYSDAWKHWKAGVRTTIFPRGTFLMRIKHQVNCVLEKIPSCKEEMLIE